MAAPMKRVVGWFNRDEWEMVYQELYSEDPSLQKHAIGRIAVWKSRLIHRLSTAVECTSQLVSAHLADLEAQSDNDVRDQHIRLIYAMALVRFVNLLTELGQTKFFAQPVHIIAEELGLPEWLVELRHDATHANLPSIHMLRSASNFALDWLRKEYWEEQKQEDPGSRLPRPGQNALWTRSNIMDALVNYMQYQYTMMNGEQGDNKKLKAILSDITNAVSYDKHTVVEAFLSEGYLVPTRDQLSSLDCFIPTEYWTLTPAEIVPDVLVRFWKPLLKQLHEINVTPFLVEQMLTSLKDNSLNDAFLTAWATLIIHANITCDASHTYPVEQRMFNIYKKTCSLNIKHLLSLSLQKPNRFTKYLLARLLPLHSPAFSEEEHRQLQNLVAVFTGEADTCPSSKPFTLHTLLESSNYLYDSAHYCAQDWRGIPIGECSNSRVTSTSLELPQHVNCIATMSREHRVRSGPKDAQTAEDDKVTIHEDSTSTETYTSLPQSWLHPHLQNILSSVSLF